MRKEIISRISKQLWTNLYIFQMLAESDDSHEMYSLIF